MLRPGDSTGILYHSRLSVDTALQVYLPALLFFIYQIKLFSSPLVSSLGPSDRHLAKQKGRPIKWFAPFALRQYYWLMRDRDRLDLDQHVLVNQTADLNQGTSGVTALEELAAHLVDCG